MAQFSKKTWVRAVEEKCRECIYDPYSRGTWREQVEGCTSPSCALYGVRPLPAGRSHENEPVFPNRGPKKQPSHHA